MRFALLFSLFLLLSAGCVPGPGGRADSFGLDLSMPEGTKVRGAVVFVADGLNARVFQEMLEAGELPAISKYFAERGLYAPRAVANIPSVTMANLTSFVTGLFPGHHGITGINWFDRNRLLWRDYTTIAQKNTLDGDYTAATIYELLPDRTTFSVFFQPHRGATKFVENWTSAGPPYFFGWYEFVDRLTLSRLKMVAEVARKRREWPAVTILYLLSPDFRAYGRGVSSTEYREALKHTDRQVGRVLGDFEKAGLLEKLIVVLISDHGMVDVGQHWRLQRIVGKSFLDIAPARRWERSAFEERLDYYRRYSSVYYGSGDRYAAICVRKPIRSAEGELVGFEPWPIRPGRGDLKAYPARQLACAVSRHPMSRPADLSKVDATVDLPGILLDYEAVDAVAYAAARNRVRLRRKAGEVEFRQDGGRGTPISYHLIAGRDPLGWAGKVGDEALNGRPFGSRDWLEMTAETDFPDLPAQILAYFRAPRAGDIAVFAAPGYDFTDFRKAGHGGLRAVDMHVPLLIAGPGVPKGRVKVARAVDVMPTLLELLGRPIPQGLDGKPLVR
jgi:arylsulfatase A-like enzyme